MCAQEYYFEYLKQTDRFPQSIYHKAKHDIVRKTLYGIDHESTILDAGCGVGNITGRYCSTYSVVGIDEQLSSIQYCQKSYKGRYIQANLYKIPLPDNTFDLILFLDAIEHLAQPETALQELARVLKKDGLILICTMNYANPLWFILQHTWHRFFGGPCKPYSKDVHPTPYNSQLLQKHCNAFFKEIYLQKRMLGMELFYLGKKWSPTCH